MTTTHLILFSFLDGASPSAASTITLTDYTDGTIIQRQSGVGSLALAGTYTDGSGAPTSIQARVVLDGTSTEVLTWTTIDVAPAGGTFSGTLSGIPEGGWYNIEVRFGNDTGVTDASTNKVGVGAWYLCIGQSLQVRPFNTGGSTDGVSTVRCISSAQATSTIAPKNTLAALPSGTLGAAKLANDLVSALGIPIGLIDGAVGGTSVTQWDGNPLSTYLDAAVDTVNAIGGKIEGVLIDIGQTDASLGVAQATYSGSLYDNADSVVKMLRANVTNASGKSNLPVFLGLVGRSNIAGTTDARMEAIRDAQRALLASAPDFYWGSHVADIDLTDDVHPTAAGFEKIAARYAQSILYTLGEVAYPGKGPSIASSAFADDTSEVIDVTISHLGGSDFTPTSGINGFEVLDDGTPVTVSTAARQSATVIRLTLAAAITGTATVRYLYGQDGGVTFASTYTSEVVDNTSLALPLNGSTAISVEAFVEPAATQPVHTGAFGPIPKKPRRRKIKRDEETGIDFLEPLEPVAKEPPTDRVMTAAELSEMRELLLEAEKTKRRTKEEEMLMLLLMAA